jgi:5'(3')-deoxyribonucleotidase
MDGVLVDFGKKVNEIDLELLKNAAKSVVKLHESDKYDLFIAMTAPWNNPSSFSDKRIWIEEYFGEIFKKKMFIKHR